MLKKLGILELIIAIQAKIEERTGLRAYDDVPDNAPAPFYIVEFVNKVQENTKTMWCEVFNIWIHAIAKESSSKLQIYELIEKLEEAMTEEIRLPESVVLLRQMESGVESLQEDETGEMHAVIGYEIKVSYGYKAKI